jgi:hypothetical protein
LRKPSANWAVSGLVAERNHLGVEQPRFRRLLAGIVIQPELQYLQGPHLQVHKPGISISMLKRSIDLHFGHNFLVRHPIRGRHKRQSARRRGNAAAMSSQLQAIQQRAMNFMCLIIRIIISGQHHENVLAPHY